MYPELDEKIKEAKRISLIVLGVIAFVTLFHLMCMRLSPSYEQITKPQETLKGEEI